MHRVAPVLAAVAGEWAFAGAEQFFLFFLPVTKRNYLPCFHSFVI
jgi:hypothetical protein